MGMVTGQEPSYNSPHATDRDGGAPSMWTGVIVLNSHAVYLRGLNTAKQDAGGQQAAWVHPF